MYMGAKYSYPRVSALTLGQGGQALDVGQRHRVEHAELHLALLERGRARGGVGDDPDHDGVQVRLALVPVVRVPLQANVVALLPLLEDEGAGADRGVQGGVGDEVLALVHVLGQHLGLVRAEGGQEHRRRLGEPEHHGGAVGRVDRRHLAEGHPAPRVQLLPDLLEGKLHVGRGERLAVVPGHASPQLEGVGLAVGGDRPRLGQGRARLQVEVVVEQSLVDLRRHRPDEGRGVDPRDQRRRLRALDDGQACRPRAAGPRRASARPARSVTAWRWRPGGALGAKWLMDGSPGRGSRSGVGRKDRCRPLGRASDGATPGTRWQRRDRSGGPSGPPRDRDCPRCGRRARPGRSTSQIAKSASLPTSSVPRESSTPRASRAVPREAGDGLLGGQAEHPAGHVHHHGGRPGVRADGVAVGGERHRDALAGGRGRPAGAASPPSSSALRGAAWPPCPPRPWRARSARPRTRGDRRRARRTGRPGRPRRNRGIARRAA